jgi:hypothetical protein
MNPFFAHAFASAPWINPTMTVSNAPPIGDAIATQALQSLKPFVLPPRFFRDRI